MGRTTNLTRSLRNDSRPCSRVACNLDHAARCYRSHGWTTKNSILRDGLRRDLGQVVRSYRAWSCSTVYRAPYGCGLIAHASPLWPLRLIYLVTQKSQLPFQVGVERVSNRIHQLVVQGSYALAIAYLKVLTLPTRSHHIQSNRFQPLFRGNRRTAGWNLIDRNL